MQTSMNLLVNGASPVTVGGTGTSAKYFPNVSKNFTAGAGTGVGVIYPQGGLTHNNQLLHVMAVGNAAPDATIACPTFKIELVATTTANPTSASSWTAIASPAGITFGQQSGEAGATQPWYLEAWLQADNTSGYLHGRYQLEFDNDVVALHALDNVLTGINMNAGAAPNPQPPFNLAVRVTFGTSGANNTASMYQFVIES